MLKPQSLTTTFFSLLKTLPFAAELVDQANFVQLSIILTLAPPSEFHIILNLVFSNMLNWQKVQIFLLKLVTIPSFLCYHTILQFIQFSGEIV